MLREIPKTRLPLVYRSFGFRVAQDPKFHSAVGLSSFRSVLSISERGRKVLLVSSVVIRR